MWAASFFCCCVTVCSCGYEPSVTEDSGDTKNLSRAQSAAVQRSPLLSLSPVSITWRFSSSSFFLFALSPGVSVPFPLHLLPINNTETEQQPPLSPTGLNFKHITALTGHSEQAANAAAARHGKELITQGRITLVSLQTNLEGSSSHCCNSSCMTFSWVFFFFFFLSGAVGKVSVLSLY